MSFSGGLKKTAFVGAVGSLARSALRPLGSLARGAGKVAIKASGGTIPAAMNAYQVMSDTGAYNKKFKAVSRGVGGIS